MSDLTGKQFILNSEIKDVKKFEAALVEEGISLYEVIRIVQGVPLFLEKHLERLIKSSRLTKFNLWMDEKQIEESLSMLIRTNSMQKGNIKLVFNKNSRGEENYIAYFSTHSYPDEKLYGVGVPTVLYHGERNNPNAKVINTDFRQNVDKAIKENNAYEAILVDKNEFITEGSRSNIFMVKGHEIITAPLEDVLPGVTRGIIMELCENLNIKIKEEKFSYKHIKELDGIFITGTSPKVLPICSVNDIIFNSAQNNIVLNIMTAYNKIIENYINRKNIQ